MKELLRAAEQIEVVNSQVDITVNTPEAQGDSVISGDEQKEIMKEIDRISGQSRINVTPDLFKFSALKTGFLFPLLVNLVAIAVLGSGILATRYYFEVKDQEMLLATAEQQSAEGNLIKEIKKETEQRLAEKESEIQDIQANMEKIESERLALEQDMNSKINERESELQAQMEAALAAERNKLQAQGLTSEKIEEQIARLELEQASVFEQELADFREEAELEKIEMEANLNQLQNEYNTKLAGINEERQRIENEAQTREAELTARMESRTRELETEKTAAQEEIRKLTEEREQESLIENQIVGFYKTIEDSIKEGELDRASDELKNLENYLYDDSVINLPGLTKRREIDLFVIDSLSKLVDATKSDPVEELDTMSLLDAAERLKDIQQIVQNADQQQAVGNTEMAELMYRNALEKIPEINRSHRFFIDTMESELELGYEQLADIQNKFDQLQRNNTLRKNGVTDLLTDADRSFNSGNYNDAVEAYKRVLKATGFEDLDTAADRMLTSGNKLAVAPFKETINGMNDEITTLETDNEKSLKELEALENRLKEKDLEIESIKENLGGSSDELNALKNEYDKSLQDLEVLKSRLTEKDLEIESILEKQGEGSLELTEINNRLLSSETEMAELNEKLISRDTELDSLNDKLESEKNQVISLKEELEKQTNEIYTYEERIDELRQQLLVEKEQDTSGTDDSKLIDSDIAELTTLKTQLNRLNKSYTDFELMADNLEDNIQGDAATINALYDFFEEDSVEDVMPGISEYLRSFSSVYITAGTEIGLYEAVSLLYDLNSLDSVLEKTQFIQSKRQLYSNNDAMIEILNQIEKALAEEL